MLFRISSAASSSHQPAALSDVDGAETIDFSSMRFLWIATVFGHLSSLDVQKSTGPDAVRKIMSGNWTISGAFVRDWV